MKKDKSQGGIPSETRRARTVSWCIRHRDRETKRRELKTEASVWGGTDTEMHRCEQRNKEGVG